MRRRTLAVEEVDLSPDDLVGRLLVRLAMGTGHAPAISADAEGVHVAAGDGEWLVVRAGGGTGSSVVRWEARDGGPVRRFFVRRRLRALLRHAVRATS